MPIPRQLFDQELDPTDQQVLDLLDSDREQAYSAGDLADKLGYTHADLAGRIALALRLLELVARELVEARKIHGMAYYASAKRPGE